MFHFISWSSFFLYITTILAIYWFTVGILYYRGEIVSFINSGPKEHLKFDSPASGGNNDHLFDECNDCAIQLRSVIRQNSIDKSDKDKILLEAKDLLRQHPQMFQAKWQIPINNLIEYECMQHCDILIEEKDLQSIWKK
jgi:hypothetical protein